MKNKVWLLLLVAGVGDLIALALFGSTFVIPLVTPRVEWVELALLGMEGMLWIAALFLLFWVLCQIGFRLKKMPREKAEGVSWKLWMGAIKVLFIGLVVGVFFVAKVDLTTGFVIMASTAAIFVLAGGSAFVIRAMAGDDQMLVRVPATTIRAHHRCTQYPDDYRGV